jgi:hypothetical protein
MLYLLLKTQSFDLSLFYTQVHVFNILAFSGEPCETEEMSPQWFPHEDIPFGMLLYFDYV